MALMTKAEYARQNNWSRAYLSKKEIVNKLAGALVTDDRGKTLIDSEKADQIFKMTEDPARSHLKKSKTELPPSSEGEPEISRYDQSRAKLAEAKAEEAILDLAKRKDQTLDKDQVVKAISAAGATIREHLQSRNRRIANQCSTMTDAREIKSMLDEDDRSMLEMVSHDLMRKLSTTDGDTGDITLN